MLKKDSEYEQFIWQVGIELSPLAGSHLLSWKLWMSLMVLKYMGAGSSARWGLG